MECRNVWTGLNQWTYQSWIFVTRFAFVREYTSSVNMMSQKVGLTTENLINAVQNEQLIWVSSLNASEEDKDLTCPS